jgi:hypothetical protein
VAREVTGPIQSRFTLLTMPGEQYCTDGTQP